MLTGCLLYDSGLNKIDVILSFIKISLVKINIIVNYIIPMKLNLINYFKWIKEDE